MTRTKAIRFNAATDEPLLIQSGKEIFSDCKGKWKSDYFHNNNPIVLELACGRGEYTVWLSQIYPDKIFVWVDVKAERMMMGIKKWKEETANSWIKNIAFLRTIIHHIDQFFDSWEVDEIWIVHPDPRPKWHDERRRITSLRFLKMYYNILKPNGILRLKTDDDGLFEYSLEKLNETEIDNGWIFELQDHTRDLSDSSLSIDHHGIETHYGKMFVAEWRTIKYAVWKKK